ncbi:MAG: nicotinate (nicotinamide) nucleotide adenylyltransferase [Acholeplasmataceae bacterium]
MILVIGGAFNPPTLAHYEMIISLKTRYPLARVILLPVGNPYPKSELVPFKHRLAMLYVMCQSLENVGISDLENMKTFEGTYHSLNQLKKEYPQHDIYFVIGSDHLETLDQWIHYQKLLEDYPFIVLNRSGYMDLEHAETKYKDIKHHFIPIDFNEPISSSMIRKDVKKHQKHMHQDVYNYILTHKLYQKEI